MKQTTVKSESSQLIVSAGKSSRLDAIRKKAGLQIAGTELPKKTNSPILASGLPQQTKVALQQAGILFEERIASILNEYPAGKKKTFFKIKYGVSVAKIKTMLIKDIFKRLEMDKQQLKHYQLIENLYLSGKTPNA